MTNGQEQPTLHAASVDLGDANLNERISEGLGAVERLLLERLGSGESFVAEKALHLAAAGGKRFRPLMTLLASEYGQNPGGPDVVRSAVIVEMVHLATLYHDDVMDEAERRRGVASANHRWGNSVAILSGDILLAHTSRLMAELDLEAVRHFADTFETLVTGQLRETIGLEGLEVDDPVGHYIKVIEEKTGVLISSAGYLGATHSKAPAEHVEALRELGAVIGVIFQIVDDIIDIFSNPEESGKTPGTDLREGVFTLPVLLAIEEGDEVGQELSSLLSTPLTRDEDVERALSLLAASRGRERSLEIVQKYLDRAEELLASLPQISATNALRQLCQYTVSRVG